MTYILNQDQLGLKKGAVAKVSDKGQGYIVWLNNKDYITLPKSIVENSEYFDKQEEKVWNKMFYIEEYEILLILKKK